MIKKIRIFTLIAAFFIVVFAAFFINPKHELSMAYAAYEYGDFDQAMRHARRAYFTTGKKDIKIKALNITSDIAIKEDKFIYALKFLNKAVHLSNKCCLCYLKRGYANYALKHFSQSAKDITLGLACQNHTDRVRGFYYAIRGLDYLEIDNFGSAENDATISLKLYRDNPVAHILKSMLYLKINDKDNAYKEAEKALYLGIRIRGFFDTSVGKSWRRYINSVPFK